MKRKLGLIDDEVRATAIVDTLFYGGLLVVVLLPVAQFILARLYFCFDHPWSRVLRRGLQTPDG